MKKLFSVLAVTTLAIGIVAGCGKEEKKDTAKSRCIAEDKTKR